jgi:hypothetical protein
VQINSSEIYNDIHDSDPVYPMKNGFNFSFGFIGEELPAGIGTYFVQKTTIEEQAYGSKSSVPLNTYNC